MNRILLSAFLYVCLSLVIHAAELPKLVPMPQLAKAESWQSEDPALLPVIEKDEYLVLGMDLTGKDGTKRLMLKTPVTLEQGQTLYFDADLTEIYPTKVQAVIKDSQNHTFLFMTNGYGSIQYGTMLGGIFRGPLWGLGEARTGISLKSWKTVSHPNTRPVPPYQLLGFELTSEPAKSKKAKLYLRNFRLCNANYKNEPFYYNFNGQTYGSVDGLPKLRPSDILAGWGNTWILDWELRDSYAGQPVMTGSRTWNIDPKGDPLRVQLSKNPIEIPVKAEGTYWIRGKIRNGFNKGQPTCVKELDFRYMVLKGDPAKKLDRISADARIGQSQIRIAYDRKEFIWENHEKWTLKFRIFDGQGKTAKLTISEFSGKQVFAKNYPVTEKIQSFEADINSLSPGPYYASVSLIDGKSTRDSLTRLIGKKGNPEAKPMVIPKGLPSAKDIRDGDVSLALFAPMVHDKTNTVKYYVQLMDEMVKDGKVKEFEIQSSWQDLEPLPGIYDFSILNTILDEAQKRGLRAFFTMAPLMTPEWMPAFFTQNAEGAVFGHTHYLFHRGRQNIYQEPVLQKHILAFLKAMGENLRNHPALLGYFYIVEHGGEAPWNGWYEGFDPCTKNNFRVWAKNHFGTIEKANQVWKTSFKSFEMIEPPVVGKTCCMTFRRDWVAFRKNKMADFTEACIRTLREADPYRIIMYYGYAEKNLAKYTVISANGGCATPERGYQMRACTEVQMPQRAEEISCHNWYGWGPYQLDWSFFNMMSGGGMNSHIKMFTAQGEKFTEDGKKRCGMDRFEKFLPVWKEIRGAKLAGEDICGYGSKEGAFVKTGSVNEGHYFSEWNYKSLQHSQLQVLPNVTDSWKKTKMTVISINTPLISQKECDELVDYVKNGGSLFMTANTGNQIIEDDGMQEYSLLRKFGFAPPVKAEPKDWYATADAAPGSRWSETGSNMKFVGRGPFIAPEDCGEILMRFTSRSKTPALTVKPFGKGKVYVAWFNDMNPIGFAGTDQESMFRMIAKDAGVKSHVDSDNRQLLVNFLRKDNTWYLVVMQELFPPWFKKKLEPLTATVKLPCLPDGKYKISELIQGKMIPAEMSSDELKEKGLQFTLGPGQVWLIKLEKEKTFFERIFF